MTSMKGLLDRWKNVRFEVFIVVKIQVTVFWVLTPHSVTVGYQHYRGSS
jgi:hypothetical protein